ncbi:MAG: MFS transporter [Clostridiales bacterium]|nr:MFS transporter [Clostridiales bacterium]
MSSYTSEQKSTIVVVIITAFAATFTGSALNLSIPAMGRDFNVSASMIGWVVTSYMLTVAALSVPFGRLADVTRKKKVFLPGLLIFSVSSLSSAFMWDFTGMIVLRALQGVGGAMIFCTNTAILISAFPGSERGKVLGYSVASTYIGLSAGPVVGGLMNHYFGWRSIFLLTFVISGMVFYTALRKLPEGGASEHELSFDILGNLLYITMIVALMYGFSAISTSRASVALIAAGALLVVAFVWHELKTEYPIIQIRSFTGNVAYAFSNIAALLNYGSTFAIGYLLSIYLQVVLGYSSQAAGLVLITQPAVMALLSPYAGNLSDRVSPFLLASAGMGCCAVGIVFFIFISTSYPLWLIILALVITGIGFALFSSPNTNAVMACVEAKDYGVASSILATMRSLGHTSSMAIVTLVVGMYMGNSALASAAPEVLIKMMHTSFKIFAVICLIGIFFSAKRK